MGHLFKKVLGIDLGQKKMGHLRDMFQKNVWDILGHKNFGTLMGHFLKKFRIALGQIY